MTELEAHDLELEKRAAAEEYEAMMQHQADADEAHWETRELAEIAAAEEANADCFPPGALRASSSGSSTVPIGATKLAGGTNGLCSPRWVKCLSQWLSEDWWPELSSKEAVLDRHYRRLS